MLRLLGILIVLFFIFQVGVSFGKHAEPNASKVIANETELEEKEQDIESFEVKHTKQLNEKPKGSELFMIASFLETGLKKLVLIPVRIPSSIFFAILVTKIN